MKYLSILGMLLFSVEVSAYECGSSPFRTSENGKGVKVGLFIQNEDFVNSPKWSLGSGEPPLSISKAASIISDWANQNYTKFDSMKISSITLQENGCLVLKDHWIYVVDINPIIDGNELFGGGYMAAITMEGKIIEPRDISE